VLYLDSSAIVKLVAPELETASLVEMLRADPDAVSSSLARVETIRAARRAGSSRDRLRRAEAILDRIALVPLEEGILHRAAHLTPADLRTLDAIHLATALQLEPDVTAIVTYDARLAKAAGRSGLMVIAPS
jgi:predicted nucleic acid-binding protein